MRLLVLSNDIDESGGASIVAFRIFNLYKSKLNYTSILSYKDLKSRLDVFFLPLFYIFNPVVFFKLYVFIKKKRITHVNIHNFAGKLTISSLLAAKFAGAKVVLTIHDYRLICSVNSMLDEKNNVCSKCTESKKFILTKKCSNKSILKSAFLFLDSAVRDFFLKKFSLVDRFHFVSNFSHEIHSEYLKGKANYDFSSNVIKNFLPYKNEINGNDLQISRKNDKVIYVGRISNEKGIFEIADASEKLHVYLDLYGLGPLTKKLINRISSYKYVTYKGAADNRSIVGLISKYRFFILFSKWYENNPLSVIESLAAGTPLLVSNMGGLPEFFGNDVGLISNDVEELLSLSKAIDNENYFRLVSNCLEEYRNTHTEDNFIDKFNEFLK